MAEKSGIAWTDATWNPWRGCTKVSEGCAKCYMYREQARYGMEPSEVVRASKKTFNLPRRLKPGTMVFTCSWSDFFHEAADEWRDDAWNLIRFRPDLTFQICTKRIDRVEKCLPPDWPFPNVWLGVTAENQKRLAERAPILVTIPAAKRFISAEPLLGPLGVLTALPIDWIIVGGESGPGARTMELRWAESIRDQCHDSAFPRIAFFMKQLGGWPNKRDKMADFPEDLRIREFPRDG